MRAVLRWKAVLLAGGLWLAPAAALAQQTAPATTNTPATDAIGPSELQNFSLPGTKTRPAEQPPATPPATTSAPQAQQPAAAASSPASPPVRRNPVERPAVAQPTAPTSAPPPSASPPVATQPLTAAPATTTSAPVEAPTAAPPPSSPGGSTLAPERSVSFLPWLIAGLALAGGLLFFLWQRRPREALANGSQFDLFVVSEPEPEPAPVPQTPRAAPMPGPPVRAPVPEAPKPKAPFGIVSSRLRPSLEIGVQPLRCVVDDSQVTIEFELDLFNAGSAPARAILAEATLFNPGATQDQELSAFFANPVGAGNRLDAIPPLKRITLTSQVVAPRAAIQEYELAGHKSFVPVIAFNALYEWSGGKGQTSAAYLVGRETSGDKLGPVRLDQGTREVRKLSARALPTTLRI
jgi:hypothetical protein